MTLVASTKRPIPMRARPDLTVEQSVYQGVTYQVIKDAVSLKYFRLKAEQFAIWELLDGQRSLEDIRDAFQRQFPTLRPSLAQIRQLITDLHEKGLVLGERRGQGSMLLEQGRTRRRKQLIGAVKNVLYIKLPGWDPEATLQWLYPLTRWVFHPAFVLLSWMVIASSWILFTVQFSQFESRMVEFHQFFSWPNLLYLWITMGIAKVIHEFAHGLACKHFGGECHEIGVAFLVLSPCLYADVSDSWILSSKWRRIAIAAAGMWAELMISALALFVWWFSEPGLLNHLALNTFLVTAVTTIIFNANPLLRYDGYYILGDLLEIPNLRVKSDRAVYRSFAKQCLGIDIPADSFAVRKRIGWFVLYSISAALYRWMIVFVIMFALYEMLKPYGLQNLGLGLGIFSLFTIVFNLFLKVYKLLITPRNQPMSYARAAVSLTLLAVVVGGAVTVPLPLYVEAPLVVEPESASRVYVTTPGQLVEIHVQPGQTVNKGDVLAQLWDQTKEDRLQELETSVEVQRMEVETQIGLGNADQQAIESNKLALLQSELDDFEKQLSQLTITAPCDGKVIAAEKVSVPQTKTIEGRKLKQWHGNPLSPRNLGCFLKTGTHLLTVAPKDDFNAVLVIDQHDRNDFSTGQAVEMKFEHRPNQTFNGKVELVAETSLELAPKPLSNKFGGDLPTMTDNAGRERLVDSSYQAQVSIDIDPRLLSTGVRGHARIVVDQRTAGDWAWRYLRRTFNFRM